MTNDSNELFRRVQNRLCVALNRNPIQRWSYADESALAEIVRNRPDVEAELGELIAYKTKAGRFFPKLRGLLDDWDGTLDRARMQPETNGKSMSIMDLKSIIDIKKAKAGKLKNSFFTDGPVSGSWDDENHRTEYKRLWGEIRELEAKIEAKAK